MKKVKVDCSPHPDKFVNVEIPDGAICKYGDKDEKVEIGKRKYRVIKVFNKDGEQIGIVDRLTAKYVYVAPVTEMSAEEQKMNSECGVTIETIIKKNENTPSAEEVEKSFSEDKPLPPEDIENVMNCCGIEPPYRQAPITDEEIKRIEEPCYCKPVGPQEPIVIKEGKIKSFFKKLFGKK